MWLQISRLEKDLSMNSKFVLGLPLVFTSILFLVASCSTTVEQKKVASNELPADTAQAKEFPGNCDQQIQDFILGQVEFSKQYSSYMIGDTLDCGLEPLEGSANLDHHDFCFAKLRMNSKGEANSDKEFSGFIVVKTTEGRSIGAPFLIRTKDKSVKETPTSYELKFIDTESNWVQLEIKKDRYFGEAKIKSNVVASAADPRKPASVPGGKYKKYETQCLVERRGNKMGRW